MINVIIFLFSTLILSLASANTVGLRGGGNECVQRFIAYGQIFTKNVLMLPVDKNKLVEAINKADVVVVESEFVIIEGEKFYAINEPEKMKITLSSQWCTDSMNPKLASSAIIALHEYLGLSQHGIDKNYVISSKVYEYTQINPEEFYYLVLTHGQDKSLMRTKSFKQPKTISANELILINPVEQSHSAQLICDSENGSNLYLEIKIDTVTFLNRYTVKSYDYCINKLYEFVNRYDGTLGMTFLVGLDSKTVYEINIQ